MFTQGKEEQRGVSGGGECLNSKGLGAQRPARSAPTSFTSTVA